MFLLFNFQCILWNVPFHVEFLVYIIICILFVIVLHGFVDMLPSQKKVPIWNQWSRSDLIVSRILSCCCLWLQELFKSFARFLSHLLTEGSSKGKDEGKQGMNHLKVVLCCMRSPPLKLLSVSAVKVEAQTLIKKFFVKVQHCTSEADWTHLRQLHDGKRKWNVFEGSSPSSFFSAWASLVPANSVRSWMPAERKLNELLCRVYADNEALTWLESSVVLCAQILI